MKIIYKDAEFGYQQPIINDIDVLCDVDISANQSVTLTGNLSSYARIIITLTLITSSYNANNSVDLTYEDFKAGNAAAYHYGLDGDGIRVIYATDTTVEVRLAGSVTGHVKIEGVKRTSQVSNLGVWEDITSKCTFHNSSITAKNTKVYANPLFIYIGHYGPNGGNDVSLAITLPVGYEAFGGISGSQYRQQWSGASAVTSASSTGVTFGKGRYIWICIPNGAGQPGSLNGILLRTV